MDILGKLFSSMALVKIMRLFLLNPDQAFENNDISARSKVPTSALRAEMAILTGVSFVKKKTFFKEIPAKSPHKKPTKKRVSGWCLNPDFPYLYPLRILLLNSELVNKKQAISKIQSAGKIKLVVLSGIFLGEDSRRIDILVVGDQINKKRLENALKTIESEVGKELQYAAMDTAEFHYRLGMYDKFVRDILDYPHEKLVDKIGL
ncbi:MAG: hypothetical protein NUV42_00085 [Candidatus Yonathbacteria bacterium]|nr:hypothetical protein [Candidatus Yonathbacteria bacterium]